MRTHKMTLAVASALVGVALLATGCSQSSESGGTGSDASSSAGGPGGSGSDTAAFDEAQELRKCLRGKGMDVPDLEAGDDPRSSVLSAPEGTPPEKWSKALEDCGSGTGSGGDGGADDQQQMDEQVKIAECLRDEGFDMPDPEAGPEGSHSGWTVPEGADQDEFMKALNECAA